MRERYSVTLPVVVSKRPTSSRYSDEYQMSLILIQVHCIGAGNRAGQRIVLENFRFSIETADLPRAGLAEPDDAIGIELDSPRIHVLLPGGFHVFTSSVFPSILPIFPAAEYSVNQQLPSLSTTTPYAG